jgi:Restriction endonuclease S subunits
MGKYNAYEKYKDSGVEWLGEIPEHWEVKRLKFISKKIQTGTTPPTNSEEYYQDGEIYWFSPSDFLDSQIYLKEAKKKLNRKVLDDGIVKKIPKGSILIIGIGATLGKVGLLDVDATSNQQVNAILLDSYNNSKFFVYFLLVSQEILKVISNATTLGILNQEKTKQIPLTIPPLPEQQAIANFLDYKTKQIDALINKKEALLEKLDEKRTAIISHAVTKGLDPNVPMKDSGIEWLGEIPEHWQSLNFKRLTVIKRGASPRPIDDPKYFDDDGEYAWVRIADVTASERYLETTTQKLSELGKSLSVPLEPGNLFLSIAGSVGKPIITKIKCCIHDGFVYFPDLKANQEFIYYIFNSGQPYLGLGKFGTQLNLNTETVGGITIGLPPKPEQQIIVDFLDQETKQIDKQKAKIQQAIDRLKEYRTALITNAVTGKIDVRQVSIP